MSGAFRGAMYGLIHQKANLLAQIRIISRDLEAALARHTRGDEVAGLLEAVAKRGEKIRTLEQLTRQIAFLEDSGYQPDEDEAGRIAKEQGAIETLLKLNMEMDERLAVAIKAVQDGLMDSLREIREGQRSINAYFPMPEDEEGRQIDTLR